MTQPPALASLSVSTENPRYFSANGKAVYLTGSHIWNNFHDGMGPGGECGTSPEVFDYAGYLDFLREHGHNFIRLWRWEQFRSQADFGRYHLCMTPQPWLRTGPGNAKDGKPKFDLSKLDQAYFDRLRERVIAAGNAGIYVAVMFFEGWALHLSPGPDNVEGHPFHAASNVNGVGIGSIVDYQALPLDPRVQVFQESYIRKVIDTVQDLPNVLYEVANESSGGGRVDQQFANMMGMAEIPDWGDSTDWQYWVIDVVKRYEREKRYRSHPIGMTMQFPVADQTKVNDPLYGSGAEWISPGYDDEHFKTGGHPVAPGSPPSRWYADPPPNDGRKVVITDTDHYAPGKGDTLWAWKSFVRGHHPILMDFGIIAGVVPAPGTPYAAFEAARYAMGDTRAYADKMNLVAMQPRGDLASTGFALANPGNEYLVLQPAETSAPITVSLEPGGYDVEWHNLTTRAATTGQRVDVGRASAVELTPPFAGPFVVYLRRQGSQSSSGDRRLS